MTPDAARPLAALLAAWLIGTLPTAWLAVRFLRHEDLRRRGSGNIGATNAGRVLGPAGFLGVFLVDAAKGAVATWLVARIAPTAAAWGGTAAIIGHCWPPWLGFAGGKGVATLLGMTAVLSPPVAALAVATWLVAAATVRIASVASLCAVGLIGASQLIAGQADSRVALLSACLIVFLQHRDNLARLRTGDEPRLGETSSHRAAE